MNFLRSHNLSDALILGEGPLESLEFQHDRYLIPILPDDALLFNLEELPGKAFVVDGNLDSGAPQADARSQVRGLQDQFDRLKMEFTEYRSRVDQSFNKSLNEADDLLHSHSKKNGSQEPSSNDGGLPKKAHESEEYEAGYFDSYSYNRRCHCNISQCKISHHPQILFFPKRLLNDLLCVRCPSN